MPASKKEKPKTGGGVKVAQKKTSKKSSSSKTKKTDYSTSTKIQRAERAVGTVIDPIERIVPTKIDRTGDDAFRSRQLALADQLGAQSRGEGPSVASLQFEQATDRNLAQGLSLAKSARGSSQALALRQAQQMGAQTGQQAARDAVIARIQEQNLARELLGNVTAQGRTAEGALAGVDVNAINDASTLNAGAFNKRASDQATLGQELNLNNAKMINDRRLAQADINTRIKTNDTSASSNEKSAGITSSANRYASQLNYLGDTQRLGFDQDKWYQGGTNSDNNAEDARNRALDQQRADSIDKYDDDQKEGASLAMGGGGGGAKKRGK